MYEKFAQFYDRAQGDAPTGLAKWITGRALKYAPDAMSVLELGCGTGAVLDRLPASWQKTGVDISEAMLSQARAKCLNISLLKGDIRDLHLQRRFDLVTCVYDTVNHLVGPSDWERVFRVARAHLNPGGLFLFDMHTLSRLRKMPTDPAWVHDFDGNTLIMSIREAGVDLVEWTIRVFRHEGEFYSLHTESILETSLPLERVAVLLNNSGLDVIEMNDGPDTPATEDSRRVLFTCRAA